MENINQIASLNRKAKSFLLDQNISKKGVEVMAFGFHGFINGVTFEDCTLIRIEGKWFIHRDMDPIVSIGGELDSFQLTVNTIQ